MEETPKNGKCFVFTYILIENENAVHCNPFRVQLVLNLALVKGTLVQDKMSRFKDACAQCTC